MYKYKISLRVFSDGFFYTVSTDSVWISDENLAFHETHEQISYLKEKYPEWDRFNVSVKLYSGDYKHILKSWSMQEYNWGAE